MTWSLCTVCAVVARPVLIPTLEMILLIMIERTMAGDLGYIPELYRLDPSPPPVEPEVAVEVERRVVVVIMNG